MNYLKTEKNELNQIVGPKLEDTSASVYQAKDLIGEHVKLLSVTDELLTEEFVSEFYQCVQSEPDLSCWTYLPSITSIDSQDFLHKLLKERFGFVAPLNSLFIITNKAGQSLGWVGLINQRSKDRSIEIGNVYFSHKVRQTKIATETIYLLLKSCFEQNFRRVEWKCDSLNQPSRNAALRFGFTYEGLFRHDRIVKGRNRNTCWFSILDEEWSSIDQSYRNWLSSANFDENGKQIQKLSDLMSTQRA